MGTQLDEGSAAPHFHTHSLCLPYCTAVLVLLVLLIEAAFRDWWRLSVGSESYTWAVFLLFPLPCDSNLHERRERNFLIIEH
jgi:hypothetical protein